MTLIKSISGIRGTIGGATGNTLNPLDIVKFTTAYATFIQRSTPDVQRFKVVVGRDGRISGPMARGSMRPELPATTRQNSNGSLMLRLSVAESS